MIICGPRRLVVAGAALLIIVGACGGQPGASVISDPPASSDPSPVAALPSATAMVTALPSATAVPTAAPTATPIATSTPGHDLGTWTLEATVPRFTPGDLVAAGDRMVAVGCRPATDGDRCVSAAIGIAGPTGWSSMALEGGTGEIALVAAAAGSGGYVAVGFERGPALDSFGNPATTSVSFTSSDGLTWRRAPAQASFADSKMIDVVARPRGGWIAVGAKAGQSVYVGFETWSSADGLTWKHIDSMPEVDVSGVTAYGDRFVAWGDDCLDACGSGVPAVIWTSIDGTDWTRAPDQPSLDATFIGDMVGLPDAVLAVGSRYRDDGIPVGTTWRSKDAATWPPRALPDGADHVSFRLAVGDHALVTVGAQGSGDDVGWDTWSSADGATWSRLPDATLAAGVVPRFPRPVLAFDGASVIFMGQSGSTPTEASVFRLWLD